MRVLRDNSLSLFLATIWLVQRGSNESKQLRDLGRESDYAQKLGRYAGPGAPAWARYESGFRRFLFSNSLLLVMGVTSSARGSPDETGAEG